MDNFFARNKDRITECFFYVITFLFSIFCYVLMFPLNEGNDFVSRGEMGKLFALIMIMHVVIVFFVLMFLKKLTRERIVFLMLLVSFFIRLGYVLYTDGDCRQYDTWTDTQNGHYDYARIIFQTSALPNNNSYQFYHPPLNAFIQSYFMRIFECYFSFVNTHALWLSSGKGLELTTENYFWACQTLSLLYSTIFTVTACKIIKAIKLNGTGGVIACAFVIFFPRLTQLSAQLNNDMICIMFMSLAIYYTIKFLERQYYGRIIGLAVFLGLAIMSKLSAAVVCLPIGVLMLILLYKYIKQLNGKAVKTLLLKYVIFVAVCAPLALWFQIYAKIRFDQSFGYVYSFLHPDLSTADIPLYKKFLFPSFSHVFSSPFANSWEDYNFFDYMTKSSLFGEFTFWNGIAFAIMALFIAYAFESAFIVNFVIWIIHRKKSKTKMFDLKMLMFSMLLLSFLISQMVFYIKMPYGCTMDFRYVVPIIISIGGFTGLMYQESCTSELKCFKITSKITTFLAMALVIFGSGYYLIGV